MPLPLIPVLLGGLAATAIVKKVIDIDSLPKMPNPTPKNPIPMPDPFPIPEIPDILVRKAAEKIMEDAEDEKRD